MCPQAMLIDGITEAPLVSPKRGRQKASLRQQPCRTAITAVEALDQQFFKSIDVLALAPELIVETHHLGDKTRTHVKRRHDSCGNSFRTRRVEHDFALVRR